MQVPHRVTARRARSRKVVDEQPGLTLITTCPRHVPLPLLLLQQRIQLAAAVKRYIGFSAVRNRNNIYSYRTYGRLTKSCTTAA